MTPFNFMPFVRRSGFLAFFALFSAVAFAQAKPEQLTNQSIIALVKAGLDKSIIITTINNAEAKFDVSTTGLTTLKKQGVPNEVIAAMVEKGGTALPASAAVPASTASKSVRMVNHPYAVISGAAPLATEKVIAELKTKKVALGYGGVNFQYELAGVKASVRVKASDQLCFLVSTAGAALPELVLYRVEAKGDKRIAIGAKYKTFGSGMQSGKNVISYTVTPEGNNLYKLTPSVKLEPGEYIFAGKPAASATSLDAFAFGID